MNASCDVMPEISTGRSAKTATPACFGGSQDGPDGLGAGLGGGDGEPGGGAAAIVTDCEDELPERVADGGGAGGGGAGGDGGGGDGVGGGGDGLGDGEPGGGELGGGAAAIVTLCDELFPVSALTASSPPRE